MGERTGVSLTQNVLKQKTDYSLGSERNPWKSFRGCFRRGGMGEAKFANTFLCD